MLANHLNAGSRNANVNGIRLSGLSKLSATKSSKGQTLLHFMIDRLYTKDVTLLAIEDDFPTLVEACVLSSITMRSDRKILESGLSNLIITMEDADAEGNDVYMEKFSDFKDKAEVLTEALCDKFDTAITLYNEACEYLAEDPKKMAHEVFFKLLRSFIDNFKSQRKRAEDVRARNEAIKKKEEAKKKKAEAKALRSRGAPTKQKKTSSALSSANDSKSKTELLMERRKRMSITQDFTRKTTRRVLTGKTAGNNALSTISGSSSSSGSSSDSSSSDSDDE
jgi:hypothetical protein